MWKAIRLYLIQKHTFNPEFEKMSSLLLLNLRFAADRCVSLKMRPNQADSVFCCRGSCFTNSFRERRRQTTRACWFRPELHLGQYPLSTTCWQLITEVNQSNSQVCNTFSYHTLTTFKGVCLGNFLS